MPDPKDPFLVDPNWASWKPQSSVWTYTPTPPPGNAKKGDRIKVVKSGVDGIRKGALGTVTADEGSPALILVKMDNGVKPAGTLTILFQGQYEVVTKKGGKKVAKKADVGDSVILKLYAGGDVNEGEIGIITSIRPDYDGRVTYTADFPRQRGYTMAAKNFEKVTPGSGVGGGVAFDSVIIEDQKRDQIIEALEQVKYTDLIFVKWGFGKTFEKGKGISMLFWGPPGTGKTLMAQAIADKLKYELKVIATAEIESSEPGQAERNIRAQFQGSGKNTVLLFDECDSLIYDRATVGAIMGAQVNELLTSLEKFEGITIFTTNRLGTLDEAVNRRLSLKLEFGMPTQEQRVGIWQRMFPEEAPVDHDVNWEKLANVEITGGYIKNAVLRAARMAAVQNMADSQKRIKMEHLVKALRLEVESMIEFEDAKKGVKKIGFPGMGVNAAPAVSRDKIEGLKKDTTTLREIMEAEDVEA